MKEPPFLTIEELNEIVIDQSDVVTRMVTEELNVVAMQFEKVRGRPLTEDESALVTLLCARMFRLRLEITVAIGETWKHTDRGRREKFANLRKQQESDV